MLTVTLITTVSRTFSFSEKGRRGERETCDNNKTEKIFRHDVVDDAT
jgi:hypothetical protein